MAATLRGIGRVAELVLLAGLASAEEEPIPFVGPPEPPPPLILRKYAGDVFSLDPFVLHIPLDDDGDGVADTVTMPLLRNFEDPAFFRLDRKGESILFRVRSGDPRSIGESDPRSELRERAKEGESPASWSSDDGLVHTLSVALGFTRVPPDAAVVAVSLHGDKGEVVAMRHEGERVVLSRAGLDPLVLADPYTPGAPLELLLVLSEGRARAIVGAVSIGDWPVAAGGVHFRAGCVLETRGDPGGDPPGVGEVSISKLYLTHKSR